MCPTGLLGVTCSWSHRGPGSPPWGAASPRGWAFWGAGMGSGVASAWGNCLGPYRPGEDGVKPVAPQWDKHRQQKTGSEKAAEGRGAEQLGGNGAGASTGQGPALPAARADGRAAVPDGTGPHPALSPEVGASLAPSGQSWGQGAAGMRRGDCVGLGSTSMALCVPFLARGSGWCRPLQCWGDRGAHQCPWMLGCLGGGWRCSCCHLDPAVPGGWLCPALPPDHHSGLIHLPSDWSLFPALLYPSPCAPPVPALEGWAAGMWGASAGCSSALPLAVRWAGVELLGPAGDAGSQRRWAGDDGAGGAGLAAGEPGVDSTQPGHPGRGCRDGS